MHKKLFIALLSACFCLIPHNAFSMNFEDFQANIKAIRAGKKSSVSMPALERAAFELAKDKSTYKKMAPLLHPDKNIGGPACLTEIFKMASKANGGEVFPDLDPEEAKNLEETIQKYQEAIDFLKKESDALKQVSPATLTAAYLLPQATECIHHSFISNIINSIFTLFSDRLILERYPKNTPVKQQISQGYRYLDILKHNQSIDKMGLREYQNYKHNLQTMNANYDTAIRRKLEKHLGKGK